MKFLILATLLLTHHIPQDVAERACANLWLSNVRAIVAAAEDGRTADEIIADLEKTATPGVTDAYRAAAHALIRAIVAGDVPAVERLYHETVRECTTATTAHQVTA